MSNDVMIPANMGALSTRFQGMGVENDLSAGVAAGFGLIGYKGKVWSIRYRGQEIQLMREDGDGPRNSIEVVILKSASVVSKIFYEDGYVEGSAAAPDCFSTNSLHPDPSAVKKQCATCAICPKNQWGSRITAQGKQGKACSDSKRLAVVPLADIPNETFGGALLLRVPAASLQDLATFGNKMNGLGYPYFGVAAKIAFEPTEAFPKFVFSAIRVLSDVEADQVLRLRNSPEVTRLLAEEVVGAAPVVDTQTHEQKLAAAFEQPPVAAQPAPQPTPKPAEPAPVVAPVEAPVVAPAVDMAAMIAAAVAAALANQAPVTPAVTEPAPAPAAAKPKATKAKAEPAVVVEPEPEPAPKVETISAGGFGASAPITGGGFGAAAPVQQAAATGGVSTDPEFQKALDAELERLMA